MPIENPIRESSWTVNWTLNASAGLTLHLVDFNGHRVLWEASLPYVTIDHQRPELSVEDEHLEPHGPWWMPLGARTLVGEVRQNRFRGGFELCADFASGPYRYTQMWRFHADGRLAPWLTLHGPGLHEAHTYHPHWRFDFDLDAAVTGGRAVPPEAFEHFHQGRWERAAEEGWFPHTGQASPEGFAWRQVNVKTGMRVSLRPHQWEDAEVFAIRYHAGEWPLLTPRPGLREGTYPAAYVGAEPLDGQDVLLWYVAHVHYDQGFPFTAGPWMKVEL